MYIYTRFQGCDVLDVHTAGPIIVFVATYTGVVMDDNDDLGIISSVIVSLKLVAAFMDICLLFVSYDI